MKRPKLDNWSICMSISNPYLPPECLRAVMRGTISGDWRFPDGKTIRTSTIQGISPKFRRMKTKNTTYTLGSPEPEFLAWLKERGSTLDDYLKLKKKRSTKKKRIRPRKRPIGKAEPIPNYGDLFTMAAFINECKIGGIMGSDGTGYYAIPPSVYYEHPIRPFDLAHDVVDTRFTHVMWFNK